MLGAIVVESDRSMMFFKLTVPTADVGELPSKMAAMIDSMKIEDGRPIWKLPEGWKRLPDDSPRNVGGGFPRVATILVDPEDPKRELSVSRLGNPGTEDQFILQNVNRWRGQLGLPPVTLKNLYNDENNVDAEQQVIKRKLSNGMKAVFAGNIDSAGGATTPKDVMWWILHALASLKFTVFLFGMSIFLVFAGTLAQVDKDIEAIVGEYFRSDYVWIPFQTFFPKSFFPETQNVPGKFLFPGGWSIGVALMINLLAAHAIRFKVQAKGSRLWAGIGVIALGVLTTWAVIASGNNKDGFQSKSFIEYSVLWEILKYGLGVLWVGMASSLLKIESDRKIERWTIVGLTVLLGGALALLFFKGDAAKLNDSSMRILWQLIKGAFAGLVLLAGCFLVFKKRAGIVLLHAGVGLIMFNELLVGLAHVESQMAITEGETVNWTYDIDSMELAIVDHSPENHDDVVVVPEARLVRAADGKAVIKHSDLPFDLKIVKYMENSNYKGRLGDNEQTPVTAGGGQFVGVDEAEPVAGTDSDGRTNMASMYVELFKKGTDESLGVYLVSQYLKEQGLVVDGKTYDIALRAKRKYRQYSVHLIDARGDKYLGSDKTRNFSSDVQLVDKERNVEKKVKIWMNNPLRYARETFYQSQFITPEDRPVYRNLVDPETGLKTGIQIPTSAQLDQTVLQIVANTGWMIPYVACMIVATGMLFHFWLILLRFLNRRASGSIAVPDWEPTALDKHPAEADVFDVTEPSEEKPWHAPLAKYLPLLAVLFFGGWLAGKAVPPRSKADQLDIYRFGKLPVVYDGRVKPFDSLARNSLLMISHKQTFQDEEDEKRTANQWLLDVIARPETADKYRVFRIEHPDILSELGLPRRKGFRYSFDEIEKKMDRFRELSRDASDTPRKMRTIGQRKILELHGKILRYSAIRQTHLFPPEDIGSSQDELLVLVTDVVRRMSQVPLAVPIKKDDKSWQPFSTNVAPVWIRQFAKARGHKTFGEITDDLLSARHSQEVETRLRIIALEALVRKLDQIRPGMSVAARRSFLAERVKAAPIAELIEVIRLPVLRSVVSAMNDSSLKDDDPPEVTSLMNIFAAYRDGDADAFNDGIESYEKLLDEKEPDKYDSTKLDAESWFNHFTPFFYCSVLYLAAFVISVVAWLGWSRPLNLTAFLLVALAFFVHTFALGMRMYISGRMGVTVTNLYSSAVFIGWACCLLGIIMEVVFRLGIGNIVAGVTGFSTLLIAHFLAIDGDTIAVMQAVLDTNFWLATHVTSITLGYATTYVAGMLGIIYVFLGLCTRHLSVDVGKILNRMIYGALCFSIFFSFVGTVLGGLWADDSWGRFWGWDPKENGALIIVLWNALVLHARWGGLVKDRGMAVLAIGGNIVTSWSWFGVNLLGVGLHAYGFKEGIGRALILFCLSQFIIIAAGCAPKDLWGSFRQRGNEPKSA
eukprot:g8341.t1